MILKRTGSTHYGRSPCSCCGLCNCGLCARCRYLCGDIFGGWRTRWLIVKESFIAYIYPKDGTIKGVILFDHGFEISSGMFSTGLRNGLYIRNSSREFIVKCPTQRIAKEWMSFVKEMTATAGLKYIQGNRYRSFAPVRSSITANWFVDGCDYMSAVADLLEQAKEEIFITDWWLSPEIQMKRPAVEGESLGYKLEFQVLDYYAHQINISSNFVKKETGCLLYAKSTDTLKKHRFQKVGMEVRQYG